MPCAEVEAAPQAGMVAVPPVSKVIVRPVEEVVFSEKFSVTLTSSPSLNYPGLSVEVIEVIVGGVLSKEKLVAVPGISSLASSSVALDWTV